MAQHGSLALSSRTRLLTMLIAGCFAGTALALPTGAQMAAGTAAITQAGNVLTVNNSANAILNWQQFNIAASEAVRFNQPSASSSVLNRVLGADPSSLLGQLSSNGRVWLVNPAGILVGPGARIDTAGFVASTLNLRNEDFLAGKLTFGGNAGAGAVVNQGAIATPGGGSVYLIAPNVSNEGLIATPGGETILAAGQTVQLLDTATPGVKVEVTGSTGNVTNLGSVVAEAGRVGMAGVLVRNSGTLNASSVVSAGGRIFLKASGDTYVDKDARITATGSRGGDIEVLGQRVAVMDNAQLDASGQSGGGSVLVGGDYQGKNARVQNAAITYFGPKATLRADAIGKGDGGKVIVWADDTTRTYGSISARGGEQGGDGGFVETSGKKHLVFRAAVDTSAPRGSAGTILLDPQDITIANAATGANDGLVADLTLSAAEPDTITDVTISETVLEGLSGNVTLQASRDIILSDLADGELNMTGVGAGNTFALTAAQHITGTADVNDRFRTGGGAISFTATGGNINIGGVKSVGGNVTMNAAGTMTIREIVTTPSGGPPYNGGDISLTSGGLMSLGGGHIDARELGGGTNGNVTLTAGGQIIMQTAKTIYGNALKMSAVGGMTDGQGTPGPISTQVASLNNILNTGTGDIKISNNGALAITDSGIVTGYGVSQQATGGKISIATLAAQTLGIQAPILSAGGAIDLSTGDGATFTAYVPGTPASGGGIFSNGGNVALTAFGASGFINMPADSLINSSGGTISLTADNMSFVLSSINAGAGNVTLNPYAAGLAIGLGIGAADSGAALGLTDVELKTIATSGTLKIGASANTGAMTLAGALDLNGGGLTGPLSLDAGTSSFSVANPISVPNDLKLSTSGTLINNSTITAGTNASLQADKMSLAGGTIAASAGGYVELVTKTAAAIHVGTGATDVEVATLELSSVELNKVTAGTLRIGNASSGAIDIKSALATGAGNALEHVSTALNLTSGGAITQQSGATIATPSLRLSGASVNMPEANGVGVVAGTTTGGDFNYKTINLLTLSEVDGISGITVPANYDIVLESDTGINQAAGKILSTTGLGTGGVALKTTGAVYLPEANNVWKLAADLDMGGSGNGEFRFHSINDLTVGAVSGVTGILVNDKRVLLSTAANKTLTVASPIDAGGTSGAVALATDLLALSSTVTASMVDLLPYTAGRTITVGASCVTGGLGGCLLLTNLSLATFITSELAIGEHVAQAGSFPAPVSGAIDITAGINRGATGKIAFLSGGAITQASGITAGTVGAVSSGTGTAVSLDHASNSFANIIGKTNGGAFSAKSNQTLTVSDYIDALVPADSVYGIATAGGDVTLTATAGDLNIPSQINAGTGTVYLNSVLGSVVGSATSPDVIAGVLDVQAKTNITGSGGLHTQASRISQLKATDGFIDVLNFGGVTLGPVTPAPAVVVSAAGNIAVRVQSPITVNGGIASSGGNVSLTAGSGGALTINAPITASSGTITFTGGSVGGTETVSSASFTNNSTGGGGTAAPPAPTIDQCVVSPTLSGCSTVLPSLAACTTDPSAAGCTAVLPSLATCTTDPTAAGCTSVLPTLATCTTDPTATGCTAVLPSLATCTATPIATGCTSVLPSLATCTANPTATGCTSVLPTLATCTANPTAAGCTSVLPSLATCTATPTLAGCTSVLPSVASCTTTPTLAGCTSVLPTLATCTTAPSTSGCTAVLPPLASCTTNPALEGCPAVLPTLASCTADATQAGCSSVLPPVAATTTSINEVVTVTASLTKTAAETTAAAPVAPTPPPLTTAGATTLVLLNTNQTIGGTEGTFGGSSSTGTASSFSTTSASSGTADSSAGTETGSATDSQTAAADTSSDDKPAESKDKKDDKKEDKKDEVQAKKQEDKPTTKKPPICS